MKSQSDYVEVKRELQMLKMIEFPTSDQDDTPLTGVKSLEKLLLSKNKSLQSECTVLKVKNAELQGWCRFSFCFTVRIKKYALWLSN